MRRTFFSVAHVLGKKKFPMTCASAVRDQIQVRSMRRWYGNENDFHDRLVTVDDAGGSAQRPKSLRPLLQVPRLLC